MDYLENQPNRWTGLRGDNGFSLDFMSMDVTWENASMIAYWDKSATIDEMIAA